MFPVPSPNTDESCDLETAFNIVEDEDEAFQLVSIQSHCAIGSRKKRRAQFLCLWKDGNTSWEEFANIKTDFPVQTATYVTINKLGSLFKPQWAKSIMLQMKHVSIDLTQRRFKSTSLGPKEMFGVTIPKNVLHAYKLDKQNGNTLWGDAIQKEINALLKMKVFQFQPSSYCLSKQEGWQYAPLRMIFAVKHDLRRKACLVVGGHVTNASMYDRYAATVHTENIRLMFYLLVTNNVNVLTGDVGTAYINAFTEEKVYSSAGPEFGNKNGYKVIMRKALYGLKTSAHAWFHHFAKTL